MIADNRGQLSGWVRGPLWGYLQVMVVSGPPGVVRKLVLQNTLGDRKALVEHRTRPRTQRLDLFPVGIAPVPAGKLLVAQAHLGRRGAPEPGPHPVHDDMGDSLASDGFLAARLSE